MSDGNAGVETSGASAIRLRHVLISLATPPADDSEKIRFMPGYAEGLVFDFDEAYTSFVDGFERLPSESQLTALQAVDAKLASMVRAKDASLWTLRACREDPCWGEVRTLAQSAIRAFDWPHTLA